MKSLVKAFFCAVFFFSTNSFAQPDFSKVKVVTSFYEPYSFAEEGAAQGIAVNQVRKILAQLHFFPSISVYPWARAYNIALNIPNTLIFSMARTPEREEKFHWIGPVVGFDVHIFKHKERKDIQVHNLAQLRNYQIGALRKDVKGQYLKKHKIAVTELTSEENGIKLLLNNRLDLMPADITATKYRLEKMGFSPDILEPVYHLSEISRPLYVAFSLNTPMETVNAFRNAYKKAFPNGL
ncbi:MAG: substrate-binding periplasmic protein [Terasakiella sp.]|uniref:substrate-binding periplasmic protein n=1 Tax=unclassified Terasakiella TaxID=2614952 RepID=UPI003B009D99